MLESSTKTSNSINSIEWRVGIESKTVDRDIEFYAQKKLWNNGKPMDYHRDIDSFIDNIKPHDDFFTPS
jgi:hypothetical protein